jgi:uncharacterized protein
MSLKAKEAALCERIRQCGSVLVAFSGGVDSSVLLAVAAKVLPKTAVLAATACSPTYQASELRVARALTRSLGVRHRVIRTNEFADVRFRRNPPARCYYCKHELFCTLTRLARKEGLAVVADGTNWDDRHDFRPGHRAASEQGVISPLFDARLTKADVRALARRCGLRNWNQPAAACLASRVPYGTALTPRLLDRIAAAERLLVRLGFTLVRVRHHDTIARIEVAPSESARIASPRTSSRVVRALRRLGWHYVTLDLAGYETGSMNRVLKSVSEHG